MHARLAEILGSLSVATDLAAGLPAETALRTSLVAVRLAAAAGVSGPELSDVYYTGLLRFLGCSAFSHEMAARYAAGDDLGLLRALTTSDADRPATVLRQALRGINPKASLRARGVAFARLAGHPGAAAELYASHCELAVLLARRLGMTDGVVGALGQIYERWDGRGVPHRLTGLHILRPARILHVAWRLATHHALEGPSAALATVRSRRGRELDPALCDLITVDAELGRPTVWSAFLEAEPAPHRPAGDVPALATAFAQFSDVKSPWTTGHSQRVAATVVAAAGALGLDPEPLRLAALLHDLGRVAIPNGIWDKRGPLDAMERQRARDHVFETARILERSPLLAPLGVLASSAHERCDGTGYHRGLAAAALSPAARLLAAADVFCALREDRPHRPAFSEAAAAATLSEEVAAGHLDAAAVSAVLGRRRDPPAGPVVVLTDRETDIVRLLARGLINKEIAARLFVSPSTVKRHLENIYIRSGLHTRAALAVWAVENGVIV